MAQLQREEEEREFERNSRVTTNDQVVTGYGGVATFVDSDGTVYDDPVTSTPPDRLERDRVREHALRSRVRNQRLLRATPRTCFGQRRRMPQARRTRPAARRSTVSSRDGPSGDDPHRPSKDDDHPNGR